MKKTKTLWIALLASGIGFTGSYLATNSSYGSTQQSTNYLKKSGKSYDGHNLDLSFLKQDGIVRRVSCIDRVPLASGNNEYYIGTNHGLFIANNGFKYGSRLILPGETSSTPNEACNVTKILHNEEGRVFVLAQSNDGKKHIFTTGTNNIDFEDLLNGTTITSMPSADNVFSMDIIQQTSGSGFNKNYSLVIGYYNSTNNKVQYLFVQQGSDPVHGTVTFSKNYLTNESDEDGSFHRESTGGPIIFGSMGMKVVWQEPTTTADQYDVSILNYNITGFEPPVALTGAPKSGVFRSNITWYYNSATEPVDITSDKCEMLKNSEVWTAVSLDSNIAVKHYTSGQNNDWIFTTATYYDSATDIYKQQFNILSGSRLFAGTTESEFDRSAGFTDYLLTDGVVLGAMDYADKFSFVMNNNNDINLLHINTSAISSTSISYTSAIDLNNETSISNFDGKCDVNASGFSFYSDQEVSIFNYISQGGSQDGLLGISINGSFDKSSNWVLNPGEIVGILFGSIVGAALICYTIYYFYSKRNGMAPKTPFSINSKKEIEKARSAGDNNSYVEIDSALKSQDDSFKKAPITKKSPAKKIAKKSVAKK